MIKFHIITIFPEAFQSYFNSSLLKKAQDKGLLEIDFINPRDFTTDKHHKVDEKPFGGGPGMVMQIEPIYKAVQAVKGKRFRRPRGSELRPQASEKTKIILFSVKGKKFDQKMAKRLSKLDQIIMICGRYEGVDERVAKYIADEEVSVGDYILTGGEIPAMAVVDAVSRFIPGVLGKYESLEEIKGSYPVYTRPECVIIKGKKRAVPKVLLSGNHKKIEECRKNLK